VSFCVKLCEITVFCHNSVSRNITRYITYTYQVKWIVLSHCSALITAAISQMWYKLFKSHSKKTSGLLFVDTVNINSAAHCNWNQRFGSVRYGLLCPGLRYELYKVQSTDMYTRPPVIARQQRWFLYVSEIDLTGLRDIDSSSIIIKHINSSATNDRQIYNSSV